MEPALRSFLDGIEADDNVVTLKTNAKNDNEEPLLDGSGMLDMREMAKRYREMVDSTVQKEVAIAVPLIDMTEVGGSALPPIVETAEPSKGPGLLIAAIACGGALLVGLTVVITMLVMRGTAGAELPTQIPTVEPTQLAEVAPERMILDEDALAPTASEETATDEVMPAAAKEPARAVKPAARTQHAVASPDRAAPRSKSESVAPAVAKVKTPRVSPTPIATPEAAQPAAPVPAATAAPVLAAAGATCDEVLCLLEGRSCCEEPGKKAQTSAEAGPDTSLPEDLSRADINAGLKPVQGRLHSCGSRHEVSGAVTIKLQISADGAVKNAKVASGDEEFQACVAGILHKAHFAKTQAGTTLSYPIILR